MLRDLYCDKVIGRLIQSLECENIMQVPKILKVCINVGISQVAMDAKSVDMIVNDLSLISGQRPVVTRAKKSISGFKIRKGDCVGCKVTLRKDRAYVFLERLLYVALPREKDFRGFQLSQFDGNGNLSFGVKEHVIFPEIDYESARNVFGMDVNVVTNTAVDDHAKRLLSYLDFPFV